MHHQSRYVSSITFTPFISIKAMQEGLHSCGLKANMHWLSKSIFLLVQMNFLSKILSQTLSWLLPTGLAGWLFSVSQKTQILLEKSDYAGIIYLHVCTFPALSSSSHWWNSYNKKSVWKITFLLRRKKRSHLPQLVFGDAHSVSRRGTANLTHQKFVYPSPYP